MTSCFQALRLGRRSVPFRDFLRFFVFLFFLTFLRFVTLFLLRFFVSIVSHVSKESLTNLQHVSVSSSVQLALNTRCWPRPRRKTRKIEKFHCLCCYHKRVENLHIYPTHPPFFYTSRSLIRARTILASGNQQKETNCACFLRPLPEPAILLHNR